MTSVVCTLFEGDYHYGVGALCNSLHRNNFRGVVCAGFRGQLPPWALNAESRNGYSELRVGEGFIIRFIPLHISEHLAMYKPDFMLSVWRDQCPEADALFYFDPDIVVLGRWAFFEDWVEGGVAVCADVYWDMPASHPFRRAWLRYFGQYGIQLVHEQNIYGNSGFLGVNKQHAGFLNTWQRLQQLMTPLMNGVKALKVMDRTFPFHATDQDALNAATMTCPEPVSWIGRQGMDFAGGNAYVMSHAIDQIKPWRKKMLWRTLTSAKAPGPADRAFLSYARSPIRLYGPVHLCLKKLDLWCASALRRFIC